MLLILRVLRAPFFIAVIVPAILGTAVALFMGFPFSSRRFLLLILGLIALHGGANSANEYYDYLSGADLKEKREETDLYGGSSLIKEGLISPKKVLLISFTSFAVALIVGGYLTFTCGLPVFLLGVSGAFIGFFYTAPPIKLASRGLGELAVGVVFGVLIVLGSYYLFAGEVKVSPLYASLPVSLLITALLMINEIPDYEGDNRVGKRNLVVRLGKRGGAILFSILIAFAFFLIILFHFLGLFPKKTLLALIPLPLAFFVVRHTLLNYEDGERLLPANRGMMLLYLSVGLLYAVGFLLSKGVR
ncbi:MAG: prenyltransferase [Acidobacteria bacterium]|nr:prenyltransferase [Acidobacteriota bacterium]